MVGLRGAVVRDVPPFALINAGRFTRVNAVGMERAGMTAAEVSEVKRAYAEVAAAGRGGAKGENGPGPPSGAGALAREIREFLAGTSGDATRRGSRAGAAFRRAGRPPAGGGGRGGGRGTLRGRAAGKRGLPPRATCTRAWRHPLLRRPPWRRARRWRARSECAPSSRGKPDKTL